MRRLRLELKMDRAHEWGKHDWQPGYWYEVCHGWA